MVDDYILWRKGKGNQNETINHALTPIIHACESAAQQQLISFQLAAIMKGKYLLALNRGVDVHKVSVMMAHSSVTVTEQVYAKFMPSTIEAEIDSKLNFDSLI